ncbi:beta-glucanase (GH16 family) [Knoellia remsis]|uniref:Beta-glucanase (GH16 family) n=1 Tax=Knoellia remsis TaxID=407159 RepID=A0A2T0V105_9MICO|nr:family 16 glycosylhydrolase [Knoellia remsis]PRY63841.1 beta-glucanase (GH16 family) [Knoellia remsis]
MTPSSSPSRRAVIAGTAGAAGVVATTAAAPAAARSAAVPPTGPGAVAPTSPTAQSLLDQGYELTWRDEFNRPVLDRTKWTCGFRSKRSDYIHPGDYYAYAASQVSVRDGHLRIVAETKDVTVNERTVPRASGGVSSRWHATFTYGYFECRFRQNVRTAGWTFVPAFWMDAIGDSDNRVHDRSRFKKAIPRGWGNELDILESSGRMGQSWAVHTGDDDGSGIGSISGAHWENNEVGVWHTASLLWTPDSYTFYIDDDVTQHVARSDRRDIAATPHYLMLSAAGHMPANGETGIYDVDYVRVYQHPQIDAPNHTWTGFDRGPWHLSASSTDGTRWSEKVNKIYTGHGGGGDFWRSAQTQRGGEWFMIDLGITQRVRHLRIVAPQAYPQTGGSLDTEGQWAEEFEIYSASAPEAWRAPDHPAWARPIATGRGEVVSNVVFGRPVVGRYLMIRQTGQNPAKKWSIRDIYAFDRVGPLA